jgi:aminoglycoside phosphotransferase family enzyme
VTAADRAPAAVAAAATDPLREKIALLSRPATYGPAISAVEVVETHMSLVFLAGDAVYKLKKPVVYPFFDFRTLAARERNCRDELRLNRRLAPAVYLGLSTITREADGALALDGRGEVIDWLVRMRRLPRERMLDQRIAQGTVTPQDIDAVGDLLARFYAGAEAGKLDADAYVRQLCLEHAASRELLAGFDGGAARPLLDEVQRFLDHEEAALRARVAAGRIVEGHGDLRPEHVCLNTPPVIIDCLEFSESLRQVDPFDEITYLGLECARLGAGWIGPRLLAQLSAALADALEPRLLRFYARYRACVRARLALAHLDDASPRAPRRWPLLAREYLRLGERFNPAPSARS